jgi:hypothetical protein
VDQPVPRTVGDYERQPEHDAATVQWAITITIRLATLQ